RHRPLPHRRLTRRASGADRAGAARRRRGRGRPGRVADGRGATAGVVLADGVPGQLRVRHLLGGGGGRRRALFRDGGGRAGNAGQGDEGRRAEGPARLPDQGVRPGGGDPAVRSGPGQRGGNSVTVDRETLLGMYRTVSRINACDERLRGLLNQGKIFIFYYSPRGQEIIP